MKVLVEYISMNGHGSFIWAAYLIATIILASLFILVLSTLFRNRKILKLLESNAKREAEL